MIRVQVITVGAVNSTSALPGIHGAGPFTDCGLEAVLHGEVGPRIAGGDVDAEQPAEVHDRHRGQ